jgi:putative restriction endonuclease
MVTARKDWHIDELIVTFALYCQLPFGKLHKTNPEIVRLATLLNRTPSSVSMKCVNFASLDPAITSTGRVGLKGASRQDRQVWEMFHADWQALADQSAALLQTFGAQASIAHSDLQNNPEVEDLNQYELDSYEAETLLGNVKLRQRQAFFRRAILASYQGRCCITGVSNALLLVASHIVPWKADYANRLNPRTGLCLSAWHDRAFDKGLLTLTDDGEILLSKTIQQDQTPFIQQTLVSLNRTHISLPNRFRPEPAFLSYHRTTIFLDKAEQ